MILILMGITGERIVRRAIPSTQLKDSERFARHSAGYHPPGSTNTRDHFEAARRQA
jgi:hypothetical protein